MTRSNAEVLREIYDRFWNEGDWDAGRDVFADDIEWVGPGQVGLPEAGRGRRAIAGFFREWLEAWESPTSWIVSIEEITPDRLLVHSHFEGVGRGSGIVSQMDIGQIWDFKDGKIVRQQMFRTIDEAREASRSRTQG